MSGRVDWGRVKVGELVEELSDSGSESAAKLELRRWRLDGDGSHLERAEAALFAADISDERRRQLASMGML